MPRNKLGELRRSAVVSTFGPGAIIDFRAGEAPVSVVAAGLEEWDHRAKPAGLNNEQTVFEPRLQKKLNVKGFRLPPVVDDEASSITLLGVRFPQWLQCPECNVIRPSGMWSKAPGEAGRWCGTCTANAPGNRRVFAVPVRFITACENGHLDEFPWHSWVQHRPDCSRAKDLVLKSEGPGLAGLILRCSECRAARSMDRIFSRNALKGIRCRGRRPWLSAPNEDCEIGDPPRVLQRGASNLYFPVIHSTLDIPPWSDSIQKVLGQYWDPIVNVEDPQDRPRLIRMLYPMMGLNIPVDALIQQVEQRLQVLSAVDPDNLRWDEYLQFTSGKSTAVGEDTEFEIRPTKVPGPLAAHFSSIVRAVRLREVRALNAFTRINPPAALMEGGTVQYAAIQKGHLPWLPAIEVRGEGIFLTLNPERLHAWEDRPEVQNRARRIEESYRKDWEERFGADAEVDRSITPRFLLLHALAHALMRQLALACGYSSASLRERLYVGDEPTDMCGVLIYTATSDSDGTLGGLVRQGLSERMADLIPAAIAALRWCSSDPLCIEDRMSVSEPMNLAACHSCMLAPETSCEEYNRFLDRALLVGQPGAPGLGYFGDVGVRGDNTAARDE